MCAARTHAFSIFPATPTHRVCALWHTPYRYGFKGRLKKRSQRLFHLSCDKRLPEKFLPLIFRAFFFRRPATLESAATYSLPRGGGLGRGHSPNFGHPNCPNTSLAACCPLSNSLPRERGRGGCWGLRVLQGKQVVQAAFCFSDDLQSTVVNPSCFSNRLQPQNLLQSAPSPVGEGWGEGILQVAATFPNTPTA